MAKEKHTVVIEATITVTITRHDGDLDMDSAEEVALQALEREGYDTTALYNEGGHRLNYNQWEFTFSQ